MQVVSIQPKPKKGLVANVNYKVRDAGKYSLKDAEGKTVKEVSGYVPETMHPKANGYGDYIRMDINENGFIAKWKPIINEFFD